MRHLLHGGAALFLAISLALPAQAADDAAEYEAKLRDLKDNIEALKKELDTVKDKRGKLQNELKKSETDIDSLEQKIDKINGQLKSQDQELDKLQDKKQSLNRERSIQQQRMTAQIRSAYRAGNQSPLRLLLNQESPEHVSRMAKYHDYVLAERNSRITRYLDTIGQLAAIEPGIVKKQESLRQQKQELGLRQQQLQQRQQARSKTLTELNQLIDSKDAKLRLGHEDSQRLQSLLNEMTATVGQVPLASQDTPFSRLKGRLPWPAEGTLRHRYGSSRIAGQLNWEGMMISAQTGAPVVAVHTGRVIFSDYLRGHGLLIIVDHGEGYMSLYAHNQTLLKQVGDKVSGGDTIARIGTSGGQSYSGLYFEIRHKGQPTDPAPWLARA